MSPRDMTDEQLRVRVAELLGWTDIIRCSCSDAAHPSCGKPPGGYFWKHLPPLDMNEMHKAEAMLNERQILIYQEALWTASPPNPSFASWHLIHATARQRCEAFVLTMEGQQ